MRVAITSDSILDQYLVSVAEGGLTRGNIYRGVVASVVPGLDASFIEYGAGKHGFLALDDTVREAYHRQVPEGKRPRIDQVLERGRSIVVQVTKEPAGDKGAALTTNISLAGRYLVLMPYDDVRGISRKVEDDATRARLRELAAKLEVPDGCGYIVRTSALDTTKSALNRDLAGLLRIWKRVQSGAAAGKGPKLLYSDQDLIIQAVRDWLDSSIGEVLVDDDDAYEKARAAMQSFMPRTKTRLVRYRDRLPLFSSFRIEDQIERIFKPRVELAGGGSLVIESTEALTAIDVNSGRGKAGSQEETAFATNVEAAREVGRQLRLRDIGGLIVVDFIDMRSRKHRSDVEKAMRDAVKVDRARVSLERISANGLLEVNRQRIGMPLVLRTHRPCPTCGGRGKIPSPETVSVNLLRRIEERAATGGVGGVRISLHPELADALQNHYRHELGALESEFDITIEISAGTSLHRNEERIEWIEARRAPEPKRDVSRVGVADLTSEPERDEAAAAPAGEREGKSRRRRRGGRRHKKNGGAAEPIPAEAEAPIELVAAPLARAVAEAADQAEAPAPAPAARRRRGRRHKKNAVGESGRTEVGASEPATESQAVEPQAPPLEAVPGEESTTRRRPRRRKKEVAAESPATAAEPTAGTPEASSAAPVGGAEVGGEAAHRRRRRRRRPERAEPAV